MEIYIKPPFPNTRYQIKKKNKKKMTFYRKEYMYEVELFHHFLIWNFLKNSCRTDIVDQGQTTQIVQSDVGSTLSVNIEDVFLSKM